MRFFGGVIVIIGIVVGALLVWWLLMQLGLFGADTTQEFQLTGFPNQETSIGIQPVSDVGLEIPPLVVTTLRNGETLELAGVLYGAEKLGASTYVLAGGLAENNPPYTITYYENYDWWQLSINKEPMGAVRTQGEIALQEILGLDEAVMCNLNHSVMAAGYVNERLGGVELGFSFCPGSVALE